MLLEQDGWTNEQVETEVATGKTQTIQMARSVPLFVTYFTAEPAPSGEMRYYEDIYRRDPAGIAAVADDNTEHYGSPRAADWTRSEALEKPRHVLYHFTGFRRANKTQAFFQQGSESTLEHSCIEDVQLPETYPAGEPE
jgi:hypothetical protein